jgi:hypothetical protein
MRATSGSGSRSNGTKQSGSSAALGRDARESATDVGAALGLLAEEIGNSYRRLRGTLRS